MANEKGVKALKKFFGDVRPLGNKEIMDLRRASKSGYDEIVVLVEAELAS